MRNELIPLICLLAISLIADSQANEESSKTIGETNDSEIYAPRPENRLRPLPSDTFRPSEEISEDFPVAFPVDI
ncbi:MAG: hypothetical protein AAF384_17365 [Pseudomonadota bacterium]